MGNLLFGYGGADRLDGLAGTDILIGGAGDDVLDGGADADVLYGMEDFDTASYASAEAGVVADLGAEGNNTGDAAGDHYDSIEGLAGTGFRDYLRGDAKSNNLWGFGNDDALDGGAGNDGMDGGDGNDTFTVDNGTADGGDVVIGGAGFDQVFADQVLAANGLHLNVFREGTPTSEMNGVGYTSAAVGVEVIYGAGGDDWIDASGLGTGIVSSHRSAGNDTLRQRRRQGQLLR